MQDQSLPDIAGAPEPQDGKPVEGEREIGMDDLVLVKTSCERTLATCLGLRCCVLAVWPYGVGCMHASYCWISDAHSTGSGVGTPSTQVSKSSRP